LSEEDIMLCNADMIAARKYMADARHNMAMADMAMGRIANRLGINNWDRTQC
jgi:hypothetical protein